MKFKELIELQSTFDSEHKSRFQWDCKITDENIEMLEFLIVSLLGEIGETANIVKKIVRGDFALNEKKGEIGEELADVFSYLLKISYQLDIDLEQTYIDKMSKNQERFLKYEKR